MLHLTDELVGDVVCALRPEFNAAHGKQLPSACLGIGGQHSIFVLAGPSVRHGVALQRRVNIVDVALTLCYLLSVPVPAQTESGTVYEALQDPAWHLRL